MKSKLILVSLAAVFLFFTSRAYDNKIFSQHFVDEEDNLVLGKYLLKGEKLYGDVFSHHQPLAYIFSAGIQKTDPNSIYLLIKRHREAIILWSVIWSLLLVARFGLPLLITVSIYELIKIYLFGNLFLAESLVVYPLLYLVSWTITEQKVAQIEIIFLGFCLALSIFLLSPTWLLSLFLLILIFLKAGKKTALVLIGALPIIFVVINFISLKEYFYYSFYINWQYYIPITSTEPFLISLLKSFLTPILAFFSKFNESETLATIKLISLGLAFVYYFLIKSGRFRFVIISFLVLGLTNIRYTGPGSQYYVGFHYLPWISLLILIFSLGFEKIIKITSHLISKTVAIVLATLIIIQLLPHVRNDLFEMKNLENEFFISYSSQFTIGEIIRIMKNNNHTLFVVPDEWLVHWQADTKHASNLVNYYAWMEEVPNLKNQVDEMFEKQPPDFLYTNRPGTGFEKYFPLYKQVEIDNDLKTLFVSQEIVNSLTEEQRRQLEYHKVEFK